MPRRSCLLCLTTTIIIIIANIINLLFNFIRDSLVCFLFAYCFEGGEREERNGKEKESEIEERANKE